MIQVKNLTFDYPRHRALDDISFAIPEGTITALVGPNGAGKTTLMKCLSALEKPYFGSIEIDGVDILENPRDCHRMVGFLPDFFGLYDDLTVRQHLEYFALAHEVPDSELQSRVYTVAEQMDLVGKLDERAKSLSRGMRQRLAIGQTIVKSPRYAILDEPASGLDPEARYELGQLFIQLCRNGMTLIVSSHILSELDEYATSILIMRNGKLVDHVSREALSATASVLEITLGKTDGVVDVLARFSPSISYAFEENRLLVDLHDGDDEQERLLAHLMSNGIPVREFYLKRLSLQDQYLDKVRQ